MINLLIVIWLSLSALSFGFLIGYVNGYEHGKHNRW